MNTIANLPMAVQISAIVLLGLIATYGTVIILIAIRNHVRLKAGPVEIDPEDHPEQKP